MLRLVGSRYGVSISPTKVLANLFGTRADTLVTNDFAAARVVPCAGGKALVAAAAFTAGSVLFRFTGELSPVNVGDRSLQIGRDAHLLSAPPEEPWVFLNHSFAPTVSLLVESMVPAITARAEVDLEPNAPLSIDYTLHEWDMDGSGFICAESGRRVRGFKHLTPSERAAALPRAAQYIREMHLEEKHLGVFERLVEYPTDFTIKVIGIDDATCSSDMVDYVAGVVNKPAASIEFSTAASKKKKYTSVTISAPVASAEELHQCYAALKQDTRVKMAL